MAILDRYSEDLLVGVQVEASDASVSVPLAGRRTVDKELPDVCQREQDPQVAIVGVRAAGPAASAGRSAMGIESAPK